LSKNKGTGKEKKGCCWINMILNCIKLKRIDKENRENLKFKMKIKIIKCNKIKINSYKFK
jgi:hypothetical protein